jgi:hypothetical protein
VTEAQIESISIPKAPRVPRIAEYGAETPGERRRPARLPVPPAALSEEQRSHAEAATLVPPSERGSDRPARISRSGVAPRIYVALALRRQAACWLESGSLELPSSVSPRHARAKQRALLVALLMEPGFDALPLGMQQRAAWLFRPGWAEGDGQRDIDDLAAVLGVEVGPDSRDALARAVDYALPEGLAVPPSSQRSSASRAPSSSGSGSSSSSGFSSGAVAPGRSGSLPPPRD